MREADTAFGDPTVFVEQAVLRPGTSRCQSLTRQTEQTCTCYERDCSLQRRRRKVIEIARRSSTPDPGRPAPRRREVRRGAGLRERRDRQFLVDAGQRAGQHVFVDEPARPGGARPSPGSRRRCVVQLRIGRGRTLEDLGAARTACRVRGAALQCTCTAENRERLRRHGQGLRLPLPRAAPACAWTAARCTRVPKISALRLDAGEAHVPWPRLTARAARPASAGGVPHPRDRHEHLQFLQSVLHDPDFLAGDVATDFIEHPDL
ncbi:hypothetical protein QJS66_05785 [Kocuria rhizophila]|nr:hypothetical protein QJS66_05785 [Kocuria rhizophila]